MSSRKKKSASQEAVDAPPVRPNVNNNRPENKTPLAAPAKRKLIKRNIASIGNRTKVTCVTGKAEIVVQKLQQWWSDLMGLLERPTFAIGVFMMGVAFIILASKEVRWIFDFLELWGFSVQTQYSFLNNFMAPFVFVLVWLNVYCFTKGARWLTRFGASAWSYALKLGASMRGMGVKQQCSSCGAKQS